MSVISTTPVVHWHFVSVMSQLEARIASIRHAWAHAGKAAALLATAEAAEDNELCAEAMPMRMITAERIVQRILRIYLDLDLILSLNLDLNLKLNIYNRERRKRTHRGVFGSEHIPIK